MSPTALLVLMALGIVAALLVAFQLGWTGGYRQGVADQSELASAHDEALDFDWPERAGRGW